MAAGRYKIAERVVRRLGDRGVNAKIIGSTATRTARKDSDIDVLVPSSQLEKAAAAVSELPPEERERVDLLTPEYIGGNPSTKDMMKLWLARNEARNMGIEKPYLGIKAWACLELATLNERRGKKPLAGIPRGLVAAARKCGVLGACDELLTSRDEIDNPIVTICLWDLVGNGLLRRASGG